LHARCELAAEDVLDALDQVIGHPLLTLVSLMDHTPGQRQWRGAAENFRPMQERNHKWTDEEWCNIVQGLQRDHVRLAAPNRREILVRAKAMNLPMASHDDTLSEHIDEAVRDGILISEFPTTQLAAECARHAGMSIVMGAPNVMRGSHSGNVSALELADAGTLDILCSDYLPMSLIQGAFRLSQRCHWPLPRALATVTTTPARVIGLLDRGAVMTGMRADFVRVVIEGDMPIPTETYVEGVRVA
jgi:alpha-D-ribose 1-methylphosphonate 5-triphosphate diphosphatase